MAKANRTNHEVNTVNAAKVRGILTSFFNRTDRYVPTGEIYEDGEVRKVLDECAYDRSHLYYHLRSMFNDHLIAGARDGAHWKFAHKKYEVKVDLSQKPTPQPQKPTPQPPKVAVMPAVEVEVAGVVLSVPPGTKVHVSSADASGVKRIVLV